MIFLFVWSWALAQYLVHNKAFFDVKAAISVVSSKCTGERNDCLTVNRKEELTVKERERKRDSWFRVFIFLFLYPQAVSLVWWKLYVYTCQSDCGLQSCVAMLSAHSIEMACLQTATQMYCTLSGRRGARICLILPPSLSFLALMSHTSAQVWPTCGQHESVRDYIRTHTCVHTLISVCAHTDSAFNHVLQQRICQNVGLWKQWWRVISECFMLLFFTVCMHESLLKTLTPHTWGYRPQGVATVTTNSDPNKQ